MEYKAVLLDMDAFNIRDCFTAIVAATGMDCIAITNTHTAKELSGTARIVSQLELDLF